MSTRSDRDGTIVGLVHSQFIRRYFRDTKTNSLYHLPDVQSRDSYVVHQCVSNPARQSLNPKAPDTTQGDTANQNETPISGEKGLFQRIRSVVREPREPEPGLPSIWLSSEPKPTLAKSIPKTKYPTQMTQRETRLMPAEFTLFSDCL